MLRETAKTRPGRSGNQGGGLLSPGGRAVRRNVVLAVILAAASSWSPAPCRSADRPQGQRFSATSVHMGTQFTIVLWATDETTAQRAFQAAWQRIDELDRIFSDYRTDSELMRLCRQAPTVTPVRVSDDLWQVLNRAQEISRLTGGAFDVTVGPLTRLWRRARRRHELPAPDRLADARAAVGYELLELVPEQQAVRLTRPGMRIDLGGIAKGYTLDAVLQLLQGLGIESALVNGGGDIAVSAPPPGQAGWVVGVAGLDPDQPPVCYVRLVRQAIAVSGDARQALVLEGKRYSHILDPRTGQPLQRSCTAAVVAPDGTTADALASACCVLGGEQALALFGRLEGVHVRYEEWTDRGPRSSSHLASLGLLQDRQPERLLKKTIRGHAALDRWGEAGQAARATSIPSSGRRLRPRMLEIQTLACSYGSVSLLPSRDQGAGQW